MYNVLAVVILAVNAEREEDDIPPGKAALTKRICIDIAKNPFIIAVLSGVVFSVTGLNRVLPYAADESLRIAGMMSTPLALISLGAGLRLSAVAGNLKLLIPATLIKLIATPAVFVLAALLFGFRESDIVVVFILFGGPSAVGCYIMAKNMLNDYELAGQITVVTTVFAAFTIFAGSFLLKTSGMI
jgi:hypothetical protein